MTREGDPNIGMLEEAAAVLGPLLDELMLVGGCAAGLLVTDPGASPIRPTEDVDLLVEATTYVDYQNAVARLVDRGFSRGTVPSDPICRFRHPNLVVDLMPLEEGVLGFSNRWYRSALESPAWYRLSSGVEIAHLDGPHFIASKLEAFQSRGEEDYLASSDLEDVVVVVDGRPSIDAELAAAAESLRSFVASSVERCLASQYFVEALPSMFDGEPDSGARAARLLERLRLLGRRSE